MIEFYIQKFQQAGASIQITIEDDNSTVDVFDNGREYYRTQADTLIDALHKMNDIIFPLVP